MNYNTVVMTELGKVIRAKRKSLNLTQEDVATKAKISVSYVSTIERGQKHSLTGADIMPDKDVVISIAKTLEMDINETLIIAGYAPQTTKPNLATIAGEEFEILVYEADKLPENEKTMAFDLAKDILRRFIEKEKKKE